MKQKSAEKKWEVAFSNEALEKFKDLPDDTAEEFEKLIRGFKTGKLNPTKIGKPVNWVKLDKKLICPECKSQDVEWLLDKNSNEVYFHCLKCNESFWMTLKEYDKTIKKNPDKII